MRPWLLGALAAGTCAGLVGIAAPAALSDTGPSSHGALQATVVRDPRITEASGLAVSTARPDVLWTVNDSGSAAVVYGFSSRTGSTVAVLRLVTESGRQLAVTDMESLATYRGAGRPASLLIGDIGDNLAVRDSVRLLRIADPTQVRSQDVLTSSLAVRYPDGPADAETLFVTPDGRVVIITKALLRARVYQVPPAAVDALLAGRSSARPVTALPLGSVSESLATGGDVLPDGRVVVRGYTSFTIYRWDGDRLAPVSSAPLPQQQQGESVVVEPGGRSLLLGSEGKFQPLWRLPLAAAETPTQTPVPQGDPSSQGASPSAAAAAEGSTTARPTAVPANGPAVPGLPVLVAAVLVAAAAVALLALGSARVRAARRRGRRSG